jgi:ATP-dependent RNA helicase DHX8/PRP22
VQIHVDEAGGDILAFLTGQEEIEGLRSTLTSTAATLPPHPTGLRLSIAVMYAALPPDEQATVFEPALPGFRKVVLATNIAETSVTLPGVRYVIDGGVVKARAFSAQRGVESLQVIPISQAQARQRSGRAGRDAPGKCFRLYPEAAFDALPASPVPEIQRSNLATVALQLLAVGVDDVCSFEFLDPPPRSALEKALEMLYALEAMVCYFGS